MLKSWQVLDITAILYAIYNSNKNFSFKISISVALALTLHLPLAPSPQHTRFDTFFTWPTWEPSTLLNTTDSFIPALLARRWSCCVKEDEGCVAATVICCQSVKRVSQQDNLASVHSVVSRSTGLMSVVTCWHHHVSVNHSCVIKDRC